MAWWRLPRGLNATAGGLGSHRGYPYLVAPFRARTLSPYHRCLLSSVLGLLQPDDLFQVSRAVGVQAVRQGAVVGQ